MSGVSGGLGPGPGEGIPTGLTQDAHVVFALPLVGGDKVVKRVGEVLEKRILLVHLQPQDAVQELADGAVCGWQGASGYVQAASLSSPSPLISAPSSPSWRCQPARDSPFSTSRQPDRDSRPPMPTDSSPCFMSAGRESLTDCWPQSTGAPPHCQCLLCPWCVCVGGLPAHRGRRQHPLRGSPGAVAPCSPSGLGWW